MNSVEARKSIYEERWRESTVSAIEEVVREMGMAY